MMTNCHKVGEIIALHKEDALKIPSKYRPISLLPVIGKKRNELGLQI